MAEEGARFGDDEPVASAPDDDDPEASMSDEDPDPDDAWSVVDDNPEWYSSAAEPAEEAQ
jgi:hypothetical protein